uniref:AB hydrolase-1 domain-containing protein n=1 Tax=Oryza glumipatula TaxID=40148 RepID=A0A0D9YR79_9ORYZ
MENNRPSSADSSPSPDRSTGFQAACIAASRHGGCTVLGFSYGSFVVFVACCGVLCVVDSGRGPEADYVFSPREMDPRVGMVMQMAWYQHQASLKCIYIVIGTQKLQLPRQEIKMSRMAL